ncbi:hypothetical protein CMQ_4726 [Grosmannia clavigera kw1407]|uniref:Secreted protein n=1 Tax=Grosmannia clavigera (strain kw1407 / UAMH 11150) TaxID=655863 RepID=F0XTR3_GROCL|nr:uncharacterized protein CMQ_4726 [Grosmannia clavigera kw1407]EFW98874.1 hypothetical protein CMQ_4726 [Grosmannia clavigera kw1407]
MAGLVGVVWHDAMLWLLAAFSKGIGADVSGWPAGGIFPFSSYTDDKDGLDGSAKRTTSKIRTTTVSQAMPTSDRRTELGTVAFTMEIKAREAFPEGRGRKSAQTPMESRSPAAFSSSS